MSENQSILEALKQAGAPDYMVIIITEIVAAKDAIREAQSAVSARALDMQQREQVHEEKQASFLQAVTDVTELSNRLYGPDSELVKINSKLEAAANRDSALERLVKLLDDEHKQQLQALADRVLVLERDRKSA